MSRILVTEEIAERGLDDLRAAGHDVDVRLGLTPEGAARGRPGRARPHHPVRHPGHRRGARGRRPTSSSSAGPASASTTSTSTRPPAAASWWSNAPQSNIVSAAEHTMALLLAQARNVPQAHAALKAGRWERSQVGGRRAGRQDPRHRRPRPHRQARGPAGAGLRHAARRLRPLRQPPSGPGRWASSCCRWSSVVGRGRLPHHPPAARPRRPLGLIGKELLAQAKPEPARHQRGPRRHRRRGGAGLGRPRRADRRRRPRRVRGRADHRVAAVRPRQRGRDAPPRRQHPRGPGQGRATPSPRWCSWPWPGEFVPFAVNVSAAEASETVRPFLPLAERLGRLFASLAEGVPATVEVGYEGQIADYDTRILTLAVLKGLFGGVSEEPVTYVNAPQLAKEHGVEVREISRATPVDYVNLITIRGGGHAHRGHARRPARRAPHRGVDDHTTDVPPAAQHAGGPQRRPARDDRRRRHRAGRGRRSTSPTWTSAARRRRARRSWCWPRPRRSRRSVIDAAAGGARHHLGAPAVGRLMPDRALSPRS